MMEDSINIHGSNFSSEHAILTVWKGQDTQALVLGKYLMTSRCVWEGQQTFLDIKWSEQE